MSKVSSRLLSTVGLEAQCLRNVNSKYGNLSERFP